MKIEFTHDIIAQKVWERLPEEERQLKLVAGSLKQRLEDYNKGNGSLLGLRELVAWENFFPILAKEGPLKQFIEDSQKEVEAQQEQEKLINKKLRSRLTLIYIIAAVMLLLAIFFFVQARTISVQKNKIEANAQKAVQLKKAFEADNLAYFVEEGIKKFRDAEFQESLYDFAIARFLNEDGDTTLVSDWIEKAQKGLKAQSLFWAGKWSEADIIIDTLSKDQNGPIALQNQLNAAKAIWENFMNDKDEEEIKLAGRDLHAIPEEISQFTNLKKLDLSGNNLKALPASLLQLQKLRELDLSGNELDSLPSQIGDLRALEKLFLNNNKISTLPQSIGQLKHLLELNIASNEMDSLPVQINELSALEELLAESNHLDSLPEGFGKFQNLNFMDLDSNHLVTLPDGFGDMPNLIELSINDNQLTALPSSFGNLSALSTLYLEFNDLQSLPESFGQLSALEELYLVENRLQSLPESFEQLNALKELYLNKNQLTSLPESFTKLPKLDQAELQYNSIQQIPKEILRNKPWGFILYLEGNPLSEETKRFIRDSLYNTKINL
jgi:Leucine-rich repeat (LRR) protein/cell division protein FtsL